MIDWGEVWRTMRDWWLLLAAVEVPLIVFCWLWYR